MAVERRVCVLLSSSYQHFTATEEKHKQIQTKSLNVSA
jgi:hypothetical protein